MAPQFGVLVFFVLWLVVALESFDQERSEEFDSFCFVVLVVLGKVKVHLLVVLADKLDVEHVDVGGAVILLVEQDVPLLRVVHFLKRKVLHIGDLVALRGLRRHADLVLVERIVDQLGAETVALFLQDRRAGVWRLLPMDGEAVDGEITTPLDRGINAATSDAGKPLRLDDVSTHPQYDAI